MKSMRYAVVIPALAGALLAGSTVASAATVAPLNSTGIPGKYANQVLGWHTCSTDELSGQVPPAGAEGIECATYQTPRDWYHANANVDLTIAVSRLKATGNATASVLVNPGGPGAPGRIFPSRLRNQPKLREHQEIVGFDVRGTGKSTNITCGGAIGTGSNLDPRDRSRSNLNLILDATKYAADSCQVKSGDLGPYITTDQTVHDLDLLRVLLGRQKVNWVGYSAGTWLGAHYAQEFPNRAEHFVLDSNTEFTTTWQKSFDWQPLGFERRWREDFLPWLAKYDSVYHFGTTGEAARQTYEQVRAALAKQPVDVDGAPLSANELDSFIASELYNKKSFPALADYLVNVRTLTQAAPADQQVRAKREVEAEHADETALGPQPLVVPSDYDDAYDASFWTIPCNEGPWFGTTQSAIHQSDQLGPKYPLLGWGWFIQPCLFWKHQPVPLPVLNGRGVAPVLMVQSTHDPATPYEGALRAHQAFQGSRMITVTGEGDHGIYAGGNAAVDKVVEDYLVDGIVPKDQTLPGMPLPVPPGA
ncbi:pimeloyl-ACP methyl ester carboxylesterase [Amycolatopsis bartoniae]|uniref:Peptidase n=1 Tax=Amycolatopsis bartoniae TaxID=941986 RepID=A0A8H9MCT1_9PSEU|nr:alpha/beta hydrolase [Amycolatopsis bartoniae]MBB2933140.1 pimeloyl-ACP methyl ester carboxylesterase [Amycolatopsis bartoniae]TVT11866.1 alpha/beta hydrolase [Amycolatopsis bartoniae]GHF57372.1 peptidase [Amycolatopsis bartoniae]